MKKWWFGEQKHIDQDKVKTRAKVMENLRNLKETGDEEGYIAYVKALNPNLSPGKLIRLIELFREQRREKR